jgi:hypothetical protein
MQEISVFQSVDSFNRMTRYITCLSNNSTIYGISKKT